MNAVRALGIIPARYASTRFPGKPIAPIAGKPMVQWVYERAVQARTLESVLVATDDARIASVVRAFGGRVTMTDASHPTGTDRLAEVARERTEFDCVVNIQGDEPLIAPESIDLVVERLAACPDASMSTLIAPCSVEDYYRQHVTKAVVSRDGYALYFSRAPIPFARESSPGTGAWKHIGLYAYRREFLLEFANWPPGILDTIEALEQLRALERGHPIACAVSPYLSLGVDTPEDVERVETFLRENRI